MPVLLIHIYFIGEPDYNSRFRIQVCESKVGEKQAGLVCLKGQIAVFKSSHRDRQFKEVV
jgi:hypothetical protein